MDVLVDLGGVEVDLDELGAAAELVGLEGHAVGEAGAHGEHDVAVVQGEVGGAAAVHAHHAEVERVVAVDDAGAHEAVGRRHAGLLHEGGKLFACAGSGHAAAEVHGRAFGVVDDLGGLGDGVHVEAGDIGVALGGGVGRELAEGGGDVLGDIHEHGALAAGLGDAEGFAQGVGEVLHVVDHEIVLGDGHGDARDVDFLEGVLAHEGGGHVAGDGHHGHGVHVGGGDAGDEVGGAGAAGGQYYAGAAGSTRVAVGRMGSTLFMSSDDMFDAVLIPVELIVQIQHSAAGVAEERIDALLHQHFTENLRTGQLHTNLPHKAETMLIRTARTRLLNARPGFSGEAMPEGTEGARLPLCARFSGRLCACGNIPSRIRVRF